ncbi:MAG TPA: DUF3558 family protein [Pseudonocardia sp.]|jgi:hypothetical protein
MAHRWLTGRPLAVAVALGSVVALGASGCVAAQPSQPSAPVPVPPALPALPARPVNLPLTNVRPCELLSHGQTEELGTRFATPGVSDVAKGSPECLWSNALGPPDNQWMIRLVLNRGASTVLVSHDPLVKIVQVGGFPAVQSHAGGADPSTHCIEAIDVAPGQNMQVYYTNNRGDYPNISHELACQLADRVATMALANLRRLTG